MAGNPSALYRARVAAGELTPDAAQKAAVAALQRLHGDLRHHRAAARRRGLLAWLGRARRNGTPPRGLYLHGPVGRGKSMLMDLFYETAPQARKRRVHFHAFMLDVHGRLHAIRNAAKGKPPDADLIAPVARAVADETTLLCFDEFQVTNIADAMILGRLFEGLFEHGVVVLATSNVAPDDLYRGGLQRDRFLPFIDVLKAHLEIHELDGGADHRQAFLRRTPVYHTPLGPAAEAAVAAAFRHLTGGDLGAPTVLEVQGREVAVPRAARGVAWFGFDDVCDKPLGAADYLAVAERFHTVVVTGIPQMTADQRNEARRFITLIDTLYDRKVNLIASAEAPPEALYTAGHHADEFRRTASRLIEMQSNDYINGLRAA